MRKLDIFQMASNVSLVAEAGRRGRAQAYENSFCECRTQKTVLIGLYATIPKQKPSAEKAAVKNANRSGRQKWTILATEHTDHETDSPDPIGLLVNNMHHFLASHQSAALEVNLSIDSICARKDLLIPSRSQPAPYILHEHA